jgi:hypothetical protein
MLLLSGILTLTFAVAISAVAAYFSIIGLATLFAATFWPVVVMGGVLEGGKLVAAAWLHANWRNPRVGVAFKGYLLAAIAALMLVTGIGIYGYLSKGHLEQEAPLGAVQVRIDRNDERINQLRESLSAASLRQQQLDAAVNALIANNRPSQATALRQQQARERAEIQRTTEQANAEIARLRDESVPLRLQTTEVEAKLGPIRYIAELFGWTDTNAAVRLVILILMFAFDPLAVVLVLAGTISIGEWLENRRKRSPVDSQQPWLRPEALSAAKDIPERHGPAVYDPPIEPESIVSPHGIQFVTAAPAMTAAFVIPVVPEVSFSIPKTVGIPISNTDNRDALLAALEQSPAFVQELVEAVAEASRRHKAS